MSVRTFNISADDDGQRLDRWIKKNVPDMPYGLMQKLIRKGAIKLDGKKVKTDARLNEGQELRIPFEAKEQTSERLSEKDVAFVRSIVLYDRDGIVVINKPSGLAVQGGTNTSHHLDKLLDGLSNQEGVKPRLVHRLDKDTSGLMVLARSSKMAAALGKLFKQQNIKKIYVALCHGIPDISEGTIKAPLIKAGGINKERMCVDEENGKFAATDYAMIDKTGNAVSLMAFYPRTGRTHQIRVHAELAGFPILGDNKYRGLPNESPHAHDQKPELSVDISDRLHLHALVLKFNHPITNEPLHFTAPIPKALKKSWSAFGFDPVLHTDPFGE